MCGRYTQLMTWRELVELYRITEPQEPTPNLRPRYNAAPTGRKNPDPLPMVRGTETAGRAGAGRAAGQAGGRTLRLAWWGLLPASSRDFPKWSLINARAETLAVKWPWKALVGRRHCLVPADGYYEWRAEAGGKQPYLFTRKARAPFAFAGLWDRWRNPADGQVIESFTIIVTTPNPLSALVHEKAMPVMLEPEQFEAWLAAGEDALALLKPYPAERMAAHPVSREINVSWSRKTGQAVDHSGLIEPVGEALEVEGAGAP
jgi:putative SOS response-associated peptidase YedK